MRNFIRTERDIVHQKSEDSSPVTRLISRMI